MLVQVGKSNCDFIKQLIEFKLSIFSAYIEHYSVHPVDNWSSDMHKMKLQNIDFKSVSIPCVRMFVLRRRGKICHNYAL